MRLAAVYFPKKSQFDNITINLGGRFNYTVELNQKNVNISRDLNDKYIENFYLNEITSINAIAGRNGVGKTSFFKFLIEVNDLVFIFENEKSQETSEWLISLSNYHDDLLIGVKSFIKEGDFIRIPLKDIRERNHFGHSIINNQVNIPSFYYYSPLSNFSLSTKYIDSFTIKSDSVFEIKSETLQRQVVFLMEKKLIDELSGLYDGFPSYESITINIEEILKYDLPIFDFKFYCFFKNNTFKENKNLNQMSIDNKFREGYEFDIKNKLYFNIFTIIFKKHKKASKREKIYYQIYLRLLLSLFSIARFENLDKITKSLRTLLNRKIVDDSSFNLLVKDSVDTVLKLSEKQHEGAIIDDLNLLKDLIVRMLINLPESLEFKNLELKLNSLYDSYFTFILTIDNITNDLIDGFDLPFLKFETDIHLSQGEEYLLNLFSSIFSKNELGNEKNIILLLDEPDLGFHPKWKKKLVNSLHKILPTLINNISPKNLDIDSFNDPELTHINSLQIIFTTHDPLTLSDLPNDKVIYLNKKDNQYYLDNESKSIRSFGANITDLLADSFFIDDGLIGDFAKLKIKEIIKWLEDADNKENVDYYKKLISIIDEPIVQRKLAEMYDEKMNDNIRISVIEKQIKELNELKEKINNDIHRS